MFDGVAAVLEREDEVPGVISRADRAHRAVGRAQLELLRATYRRAASQSEPHLVTLVGARGQPGADHLALGGGVGLDVVARLALDTGDRGVDVGVGLGPEVGRAGQRPGLPDLRPPGELREQDGVRGAVGDPEHLHGKVHHEDAGVDEEAEHQIATRLYQNTARIHFNQFAESKGRFGRRLIYGGHAISLARALSFNGLANAFHVAAINGGRHAAPLFAGDTVFAWSEVLATADIPNRKDVGALRLRTVATKDRPCPDFPLKAGDDYDPAVILDLDYWALMPR